MTHEQSKAVEEVMALVYEYGEAVFKPVDSSMKALAAIRTALSRLAADGPMMQRGTNGDGTIRMGTMRECLEDARQAADVEARYADELRAELKRLAAPQAAPEGWAMVPIKATTAVLRPFYGCPPDELTLAWEAMLRIVEGKRNRLAAAPVAASPEPPLSDADDPLVQHVLNNPRPIADIRADIAAVRNRVAASPAEPAAEPVAWADPDDLRLRKDVFSACSNAYPRDGLRFKIPLYTHPAAAPHQVPAMNEREAFEAWARSEFSTGFADDDSILLSRSGDGYDDAQVNGAWMGLLYARRIAAPKEPTHSDGVKAHCQHTPLPSDAPKG